MRNKLLLGSFAALLAVTALPALAAPAAGNVTSIALRDLNHDGRIDHAVIAFANPAKTDWRVRGTKGIGVSYQGQALAVRSAFVAVSGDPASLEIALDESDARLPVTTSAQGFEVTYAPQGANAGVSDGTTELSAIAIGDTGASDTEIDQAPPVLLSSNPAAGTIDASRDADLVLTFSEPVLSGSVVPFSEKNPDGWGYAFSGNVLTISHAPYARGAAETFGIDAKDAAGNSVALGSYPNPFSFRTGTSNDPTPSKDTVFALTSPHGLPSFQAGAPSPLAWYANEAGVVKVRLSYSTDGSGSYRPIVERPVTDGAYVWYPPAVNGALTLKAEALNAAGAVMNVSVVSPVMISTPATAAPRVVSGPDVARLTDSAAQVSVELDRAPTSVTASCGGRPSTVTVVGDRPARLATLAEGLTATPVTCRFAVSDGVKDALSIESAPITAQASAPQGVGFLPLKDGDLIKASASPAVYWYKNGKRYVFPNETSYRSWFGQDFSKVVTVPADQLSGLVIGGNVRLREGAYLIKIQSDPKTYAVEPDGLLRWVQTEAQAKALYGTAWNTRVRDVDVSLFADYRIGSPLQDGERPAGYQD